ncbi:hypothetical protein KVV02_005953 [Mortierella alpina]|uniref:Cyclin-dependent kinases regulatory subunit n=1 Tax=Mortierella alpina TaxID=64518 RepID=A0A9P8IFF2_MORAP|nr:hypothetical protein KVV02_005953 [Mortierella alpina]
MLSANEAHADSSLNHPAHQQQHHHASNSNHINNTNNNTNSGNIPMMPQQPYQQYVPQVQFQHSSQHHHPNHRQEEEKARIRAEQRAKDIAKNAEHIFYSTRYYDDLWEYRQVLARLSYWQEPEERWRLSTNIKRDPSRHVSLPKAIARHVPNELMTEEEWRSLGVKQSQGWEHYMIHNPEPHVLLFKREKDYQLKYLNGVKQSSG